MMDYFKEMEKLPAGYLDVKLSAQKAFNEDIHKQLEGMVWSSGGCNSWYLHDSGRNSTLWPGYTATYRRRTQKIVRKDFEVVDVG
jgi:hypothetical protein